mgnify:CR=1 FL=1
MGDVDSLLASAQNRFERLKGLEERSERKFETVQALLSVLEDEYAATTDSLRDEVDELQERIASLEDETERVADAIPSLALQSSYDEIERVVNNTPFHDCITRDEYARRYC